MKLSISFLECLFIKKTTEYSVFTCVLWFSIRVPNSFYASMVVTYSECQLPPTTVALTDMRVFGHPALTEMYHS